MTEKMKSLPPGSWLGMMGGGQLGRMFSTAASRLGYHVLVLDPAEVSPAGEVSARRIQKNYKDREALDEIASVCPAVSTEFENVPSVSLAYLAEKGCRTAPPAEAVAASQDRNTEKGFLAAAGVPVAPHMAVLSEEDCREADPALFPAILKTARLGYDGKGQISVDTPEELPAAFRELGSVDCILEKKLALANECSVIVCRGFDGESATFPVFENHHKNGILAETVIPARIPEEAESSARAYAIRVADAMKYVGVLCIEFFVLSDGSVVANETAPRPHNSGHLTIEACMTSQYEQQVRTMAGLPLGSTAMRVPAVMLNILGDSWETEDGLQEPDWAAVLAVPGVSLHLYGKAEARHGRKMGHVTCLGKTPEEALERAKKAARILRLPEPV